MQLKISKEQILTILVGLFMIFLLIGSPLYYFWKSTQSNLNAEITFSNIDLSLPVLGLVLGLIASKLFWGLITGRQKLEKDNKRLKQYKDRLEKVLTNSREMAETTDQMTAMTNTCNSILKEIKTREKVSIYLIMKDRAKGEVGYSSFEVSAVNNPVPQVQFNQTQNIKHTFFKDLPDFLDPAIHKTTIGCSLQKDVLRSALWSRKHFYGLIEIRGVDEEKFSHIDKDFVDILSQALVMYLEDIDLTLELENRIEARTSELENALEIQHSIGDSLLKATQEIEESYQKLEQQNTKLAASNRKLEDLNTTKEQLLKKLSNLQDTHLKKMIGIHDELLLTADNQTKKLIQQSVREIHHINEIIQPITNLYLSEQAIQSKRVLLAETDKKQQIIAKMALGGTGVELDIVSDLQEGNYLLNQNEYDILCVNIELIKLTLSAIKYNKNIQSVLMTSEDASVYLPIVREYPYLSNIVSRNDVDRSFTLKNIITTISKLVSHDLFGLEKYLNWGVDVQQYPIRCSRDREKLVDKMKDYFNKLGVRRSIITKCEMTAEELLMNAIYDAPVDADGKSVYNHLPRTVDIELKPDEQGKFKFACDGVLLAISVEDPFGALDRKTILDYLQSCYDGKFGSLNQSKGGAGQGLFQVIESSDLVVINVKPKVKTEVIVIFNINVGKARGDKTTSFHYFYG